MLQKFRALYAEASKSRLLRFVVKAFLGGLVAGAVAGQTPKSAALAGVGAAGTAFVGFIQKPDAPASPEE